MDDGNYRETIRELEGLAAGTHACIFYDKLRQLLTVAVPFVRLGLERNERCLCLGSPDQLSALAASLAAAGIDVDAELRRGALRMLSEQPYLADGNFEPSIMIGAIGVAAGEAMADGFTGLRAAGDVAWELGPNADFSLVPEYEAKLDAFLHGKPVVALCQYCRPDYPPEILGHALRTHSVVVLDDDVVERNPFHEPPQLLLEKNYPGRETARAEWMAEQLREAARQRRKRDEAVRQTTRRELSRETRDRLARVLEGMSDAFLALDPNWFVTYANAETLRIARRRPGDFIGKIVWDVCPAAKKSAVAKQFRLAVAEQSSVHLEHLVELDGQEMWIDINAYPSPEGLNVFYRDITERKRAEERHALLMREVDHRAKNALAVVQTIIMLTKANTVPDFVATVSGRIAALARAHTLLARGKWSGADLRTIVVEELAPYRAGASERIQVDGVELCIVAEATQPVAMVLHELATNAAKYGALSVPEGRVSVRWRVQADGRLLLDWDECGGPPVCEPVRRGFGSQLIHSAVPGELDGTVELDWRREGLHCSLALGAGRTVSILRPSVAATEAVPSPNPAGLEGSRVLVVEDDALLGMGLQIALEAMGCQVVGPATTLDAARQLAASEALDCALLDVNLRGSESWEVANILVARGIPHIFTTGYGDLGHRVMHSGAKVLVKPFRADQLGPTLRQVMLKA